MTQITIKRPDDWRHLRDGDMLKAVLPHTAKDLAVLLSCQILCRL